MEIFFHISDGSIINKQVVAAAFKNLSDGRYSLKIESKKKRSLPQNNFYWGIVVQSVRIGLKEIGYDMTDQEVHFFLKQKFNSVSIASKDGEVIDVPGSTTKLTTIEFSEYVERINQFSSMYLGVVIPDPNQELTMY